MDFIKNPVVICRKICEYIHEMTVLIRGRLLKGGSGIFHTFNKNLNEILIC
jgi:hypothetical protein